MSTKSSEIRVSGLAVQIVRKDIKNLHLGVYPPNGRVRVAAPLTVSDDAVRLAVIGKLGWIKKQQASFAEQARQSEREMVNGESHYFLGRPYRLRIVQTDGPARASIRSSAVLELHVREDTDAKARERVLHRWYREQLKALVPPLLEKWQPTVGVQVADWRIKRMKTKWGACTIQARRIWLNLELAKKPIQCIEYIIVHEMVHLLEKHHNDRFSAYMDQLLPRWRLYRTDLNRSPLGHEIWEY